MFSHPEQLTHTSSQLMGKQQQPRQTITSYANHLRVLGHQCYSNFDQNVVDRILKDIFVNGVLPKYRKEVMLKNPETLREAIDAALQVDSALTSTASSAYSGVATDSQSIEMQVMREQLDQLLRRRPDRDGDRERERDRDLDRDWYRDRDRREEEKRRGRIEIESWLRI